MNKVDFAKLYFPNVDPELRLKLIDEIAVLNINNLKQNGGNVYKNLKETLIKLKMSYEMYIVSNTAETEYIEAFLETSNLKKYFKDWIAASSLNISKGEAIIKVMRENNIKQAIYIGDTMKDLEAAKIADILFVQARYGFGEKLDTKYYINDISELPNVIKRIKSEDIN